MSAHTPGPWHWDSDHIKGDPLWRVRYRVVTMGKTITQTYYGSDDPCAEADACLIAAAPTMKDALLAVRYSLGFKTLDEATKNAVLNALAAGSAK